MSNPNFNQMNPNLNPNYTDYFLDFDNYLNHYEEFDMFNNRYGGFDQPNYEGSTSSFSNAHLSQSPITQEMTSTGSVDSSLDGTLENTNISQGIERGEDVNNDDEHRLVAFRIKTEIDLDDGYKWRKYGKKKVKSNLNPRNYYRCQAERCQVKKRIEKDPQDPSYVLISYEGSHNHQSPTHIIDIPQSHSHLA